MENVKQFDGRTNVFKFLSGSVASEEWRVKLRVGRS
jgi:hypothetical protein